MKDLKNQIENEIAKGQSLCNKQGGDRHHFTIGEWNISVFYFWKCATISKGNYGEDGFTSVTQVPFANIADQILGNDDSVREAVNAYNSNIVQPLRTEFHERQTNKFMADFEKNYDTLKDRENEIKKSW